MIGAFTEGRMIAFRSLLIPKIDAHHIGYDLKFHKKDFDKIVYQEITVVSPNYRGHGLQRILGKHIMSSWKRLKDSNLQFVCATVAPRNIASIKDKLEQGLEIVALKNKYGRKLRYIFLKDLHKQSITNYSEVINVALTDYTKQKDLLNHGWKGYCLVKSDGEITIMFGK